MRDGDETAPGSAQHNTTQPNPTQPNPTQPNPTQPNPTLPGFDPRARRRSLTLTVADVSPGGALSRSF